MAQNPRVKVTVEVEDRATGELRQIETAFQDAVDGTSNSLDRKIAALDRDITATETSIGKTKELSGVMRLLANPITAAVSAFGLLVVGIQKFNNAVNSAVESSRAWILANEDLEGSISAVNARVQQDLADSISDASQQFGLAADATTGMRLAVAAQASAAEAAVGVNRVLGEAIGNLSGFFQTGVAGAKLLGIQLTEMALEFAGVDVDARKAAVALDVAAGAMERNKETAEEVTKRLLSFRDALSAADPPLITFKNNVRELGVELDQGLGAQQDNLNALLVEAEIRFRAGQLGAREYADTVLAINAALAPLNEKLNQAKDITIIYGEATEDAAEAQEDFKEQVDDTTVALTRQSEQLIITARAFDALRRAQGNDAAVAAAIAGGGTLTLGGTRVRLAGGGSRLTSEPGLSSSSSIFGR